MPRETGYRSPLENTESKETITEARERERERRKGGGRNRARLKSCIVLSLAFRFSVPSSANSNEITPRKRDSSRLPSGQIRISSGDKPARDSVHRSWTPRISVLLETAPPMHYLPDDQPRHENSLTVLGKNGTPFRSLDAISAHRARISGTSRSYLRIFTIILSTLKVESSCESLFKKNRKHGHRGNLMITL